MDGDRVYQESTTVSISRFVPRIVYYQIAKANMKPQSKWLWVVTATNIAFMGLLLAVIYSMLLALAVLAPYVSSWPLFALLCMGMVLSLAGLRLTKGLGSRTSRWVTSIINGCVLSFDVVIVFGMATMFFGSTKEQFLIRDGYKGDVYVVYDARGGESLSKTRWKVTYRIPSDGILQTSGPMLRGWTRPEYYYERKDGSLERIQNVWPSTIDRTPENLTNERDVGVFFPRTGKFTEQTGCSLHFEQFYVGTTAYLLSKYRETNLSDYVHDHPGACAK